MTIAAKYENGVFKPLDAVNIKEGTIVDVHVPNEETQAVIHPRSRVHRYVG